MNPLSAKTYSNLQITPAGLLFILINVLFYFKYVSRVSPLIGIISVVCYVGFSVFILYRKNKSPLLQKRYTFILIAAYIISCVIILFFIPKETLRVDRWEMISIFWNAVSDGVYPYSVRGHIGSYPGPMPFYFILCYPFYLIGEIGYMPILAIMLTLVYYYKKYSYTQFFLIVLLLISSLAMYWEVFARSTVFFNSVLFAFYLFYMKDFKTFSKKQFYISAIIGGLLFSTRNIYVLVLIPWGIYMLYRERIEIIKFVKWGLVFCLAFALTFLPFILMNPAQFLVMNPFITQSSALLPFKVILVFICISFIGAFFCKKYTDLIFLNALLLFGTITAHVLYYIIDSGLDIYSFSNADISYFIFCFPFLFEIIANGYSSDT